MKLSIIIVTFNSLGAIKRNLSEILSCKSYPIHIIDNNSSDNLVEEISSTFPHIKIDSLDMNIGYGRAANIGLENSQYDYALLINPDVQIQVRDIHELVDFAEKNTNAALIGPAISGEKKSYIDKEEDQKWISGCSILFNLANIRNVGFFDEKIFLFYEETELCNRVVNAGFKIKKLNNVLIKHDQGTSSDNVNLVKTKSWHYGWSKSYFQEKMLGSKSLFVLVKLFSLYRLKSFTSFSKYKRQRNKYLSKGVYAFIKGDKAFDNNGIAKWFD